MGDKVNLSKVIDIPPEWVHQALRCNIKPPRINKFTKALTTGILSLFDETESKTYQKDKHLDQGGEAKKTLTELNPIKDIYTNKNH